MKALPSSEKSEMVFKNDNLQLKANGYSINGAAMDPNYTWASKEASIASVDQSGMVSAKAIGSTIITASAEGITGSYSLEVLPDTSIMVTPMMAS